MNRSSPSSSFYQWFQPSFCRNDFPGETAELYPNREMGTSSCRGWNFFHLYSKVYALEVSCLTSTIIQYMFGHAWLPYVYLTPPVPTVPHFEVSRYCCSYASCLHNHHHEQLQKLQLSRTTWPVPSLSQGHTQDKLKSSSRMIKISSAMIKYGSNSTCLINKSSQVTQLIVQHSSWSRKKRVATEWLCPTALAYGLGIRFLTPNSMHLCYFCNGLA